MKSLTVDIEPIQDLHGQANPYPAGGGKNKLNCNSANTTTVNGITMTVEKNDDGAVTKITFNGTATANAPFVIGIATLSAGTYTFSALSNGNQSQGRYINYSGIVNTGSSETSYTVNASTNTTATVIISSGNTLSNTTLYPMIRLSTESATFAPYSNICPISGHTQAVVTRTGKNLFDKTAITDGYALVSTTGEIEKNTNCFVTDYISVKEGVTYYIPNRGTSRACVYNKDKTYVQRVSTDSGAIAWTAPIDGYIRLTSNKTITTADDFQINIGSTATAYEPYNGQTVTIDLDGTRYGGTLNATTGVLTVDRAIADVGTWNWQYVTNDGNPYFAAYPVGKKSGLNILCSVYPTASNTGTASLANKQVGASGTGVGVFIRDDAYSDSATFKTAMNGVQLVYELATPLTVQLTAQEVTTLLGQNNVWADTGDVEVEYCVNLEDYIDEYGGKVKSVNGKTGDVTLSASDVGALPSSTAIPVIDSTLTHTGQAADAKATGDALDNLNETKANIDGYYQDMTVGNAEQLVTSVGINDSVPYQFRTSGGSADIGDRLTDKVVGGTIAWNQLVQNGDFSSTSVWIVNGASYVVADNVATITSNGGTAFFYQEITAPVGHKYLFVAAAKSDVTVNFYFSFGSQDLSPLMTLGNNWAQYAAIINKTSDSVNANMMRIHGNSGLSAGDKVYLRKANLIDLTQMFGSTIADYVYSLEQSTVGAGVAWFKKLFPADYYPYDNGTLKSVEGVSSHDMVGFNQWDEEWLSGYWNNGVFTTGNSICAKNKIPVLPNTTYYHNASPFYFTYYDANGNFLPNRTYDAQGRIAHPAPATFTTPSDAYYISFNMGSAYGTTYKNDICINLSWDGERDGEYEPYVKHTYPLDSDLVLRGIPKLDASNSLYYDGDTYESDGTVTRRYGVVDLGTLTWSRFEAKSGVYRFRASTPSVAGNEDSSIANMMCTKYPAITSAETYVGTKVGISGYLNGGYIFVYDPTYTDAASFKTAMSGVMLVYELATPTTETADPYQNPQIVDDFGTEEYVDAGSRDVAIPVGHETFYAANLKAKLEMSPDSPSDGDGDYIVRQTNGTNEYVKMVKELPTMPTSNGTYHLKVTVASGTPTLSWEADT